MQYTPADVLLQARQIKADAQVALDAKEAKKAQTKLEESADFEWSVHTCPNTPLQMPDILYRIIRAMEPEKIDQMDLYKVPCFKKGGQGYTLN